MRETLKWIWILFFVIFLMGMISLLPYDKYQSLYLQELYKIRSIPQQRVDATYRYIEAVENGYEEAPNGILTEPPRKYYKPIPVDEPKYRPVHKYSKPLYLRDKHNPYIWHRQRY